jgi:hypothetical protein
MMHIPVHVFIIVCITYLGFASESVLVRYYGKKLMAYYNIVARIRDQIGRNLQDSRVLSAVCRSDKASSKTVNNCFTLFLSTNADNRRVTQSERKKFGAWFSAD